MTFWQVLGLTLLGVIGLYVCARVVTAAYFKSKQDHDMRKVTPR